MLQDIRQNVQGTAAKVVVGLIVISFSLFGIESILVGGGGSGVAEVNGEDISPQELQQAVNTQKRRLIGMMGENIDPAMLDDQRLSAQAMESLINRKLLAQSAADMKLAVSEREIGILIGSMEQFHVDGVFSADLYKSVLSSAGYTPAYFKQSLREDMVLNQLRSGLSGSEFSTPSELALNASVTAEQRDVRYLTIPLEKFIAGSDISQAEIDTYYADNESRFRTLESVDLDYIQLSIVDFHEPVEDSAILEAYELAQEGVEFKPENRVSHILFETGDEETDESLQQRLADAQAQIAAGADFAAVAQEFSDDIGSASNGGDLGYSSGDAFPQEMEDVIAEQALNVVSGPVETDAGTHLIMVTERTDGKIASLEEMRDQLHDSLQAEQARIGLLRTVESLKDMSFNAEDLNSPAGELELSVQQVTGISRTQREGLFANPAVLAAAFSDDVLVAGHNSEVIELGGSEFVVLRVHQHNTPEVKPLAQVQDDIVAIITDKNARAAVAAEAERALEQLRAGTGVEQFALKAGYDWQVELGADRRNIAVPRDVLQRAFELPVPAEGETPSDFVMSAAGDALVFVLARVTAGQYDQLSAPEQQVLGQQVSAEYSSLVDNEFQRGLRESADITVL
jgi:peptidyl-prolyl cis-trans isomerase D